MRRRKKVKFSLRPKYLLYALLFLCMMMIYISYQYSGSLTPIKTGVGSFITPMQNGINIVGNWIAERVELFESKSRLQEENKALRAQIEALKTQNSILVSDGYELAALRDLYEVGQKYSDYPMVAASVISKDSNSYYSSFVVNKGARDGIKKDMNVIAGNGLVGIVTEVGDNYSKIRSIIDDTSYVSGMFLKTNDTCTVHGDIELMDKGMIRIEDISIHAQIAENYELVTSYISDKYLPGILIGFVQNIRTDASNMTKEANLLPVVDFEHIENVLIITQLKESIESDGE